MGEHQYTATPDVALTFASMEQHCPRSTNTYDSKWPDGSKSYGGYADYWRGNGSFTIKIPGAIPSDSAAPMLCGGLTVFSPLKRYNAGPGKKVGIIGIGGLGHFGILSAKALGCDEICAISRTSTKKEDALKMGATKFIATDEEKGWAANHASTLDIIISTVSSPKMPIQEYLGLLRLNGQFVQVGAPEDIVPGFSSTSDSQISAHLPLLLTEKQCLLSS
jgi:alcohol dehydrogenase (NADP+)